LPDFSLVYVWSICKLLKIRCNGYPQCCS